MTDGYAKQRDCWGYEIELAGRVSQMQLTILS